MADLLRLLVEARFVITYPKPHPTFNLNLVQTPRLDIFSQQRLPPFKGLHTRQGCLDGLNSESHASMAGLAALGAPCLRSAPRACADDQLPCDLCTLSFDSRNSSLQMLCTIATSSRTAPPPRKETGQAAAVATAPPNERDKHCCSIRALIRRQPSALCGCSCGRCCTQYPCL